MSRQNSIFRVVTYHRIAPVQDSFGLDPAMISTTPEVFSRQMDYLSSYYNIICIADILDALQNGKRLPERAVLVSFDDAYHDLMEYAWPTLNQLNIPAVLFVATDYASHPETPFWWDRIANAIYTTDKKGLNFLPFAIEFPVRLSERKVIVKQVQNYLKTVSNDDNKALVEEICQYLGESKTPQKVSLDWQQLRMLHQGGITIGAHSQSHPILTRMPLEKAESEILASQNILKHELGDSYPIFCYPNGDYNNDIIAILKNHGFSLAFTSKDGHNNLRNMVPYCLHRTNITKRTSMSIFRFRLTRLGAMVDQWRHS